MAKEILILHVGHLTSIADYFVIMSGATDRQAKSIAKNIVDKLRKEGLKPLSVHGESIGHWVVLDYGSVVVHVFREDERQFYELERLWKDAEKVTVQ